MNQMKPDTSADLLARLATVQDDLGKGGRRLAGFLMENPQAAALLSSPDLAKRCGIHASSVVRLAQSLGFSGYREMRTVLQDGLSGFATSGPGNSLRMADGKEDRGTLQLLLLGESGRSFNEEAGNAVAAYCCSHPDVEIRSEHQVSHAVDTSAFAARILEASEVSDGLILVAREHPAINAAVRAVVARGVPVVCLTSDLPSSGRTAYVGSDQFASGSAAGWFCGRFLPRAVPGKVLFVYSVPFRCQLDREQGFRQVLRTEFAGLTIDEKVSSDESADIIFDALRAYIRRNGPPSAIYNVSGANLGIGRALEAEALVGKTVFIGHELNANSRKLLEKGVMDLTIGHDFAQEVALAVDCIRTALKGQRPTSRISQSLLYTRYNCTPN
jgi:LacI family transcriptional regulator